MESIQQIPETDIEQQHSQALIIACSVFAALIVIAFNIIMPIILYYTWKDRSPIAANVGKRVINTQITMTLVLVALLFLALLMFILMFAGNVSIAAISGNNNSAVAGIGILICMLLSYGTICLSGVWALFAMGWSIWQVIQVYNKQYDRLKAPMFTIPFFK